MFLEMVANNQADSLRVFSALIKSRNKRQLMSIISESQGVILMRMGEVFRPVTISISKTERVKITPEQLFKAFNALVGLGNFRKNSAPVGKGELALALSFSDCKLAEESGDIQGGDASIEVKSAGGVITSRFYP
jgi:hypothetical protein